MPAYYSLVQYVPDLIRNERINIGVVVFLENHVSAHFIENWERVRNFGANISSLQGVARQIESMSAQNFKEAIDTWQFSIQFTQPAASLLDVDLLLLDMAKRCLIDPDKPVKKYRTRQDAIALTKNRLSVALKNQIGKAAKTLIKERYNLRGKLDPHECDLAVVNGKTLTATSILSFETPETRDQSKVIDAIKWMVGDVKQGTPDLPVSVVMLPPKTPSQLYDRSVGTLNKIGAEVVEESDLDNWCERTAIHVHGEVSRYLKWPY